MPAGVTTLAAVKLAAQQRADMVNSSFVSDAELTSYVQASQQELYGILVQAFGNDYFVSGPTAITTDGTNYLYVLASDFFKLLGVEMQVGGKWKTLKPFPFAERNRTAVSSNIPTSGIKVQYWYVPRLTVPTAGTDTIDGVLGWEEFIITDAAIKMMQKEESDVSVLMAQKNALLTRIQEEAERRDAGQSFRIADTQRANSEWPFLYASANLRYRLAGNNLWLAPFDGLGDGDMRSWGG